MIKTESVCVERVVPMFAHTDKECHRYNEKRQYMMLTDSKIMAMNSSTHIALLFVFLWSSSFIAVQFCAPHIEPATFVAIRTAITAFILYILVIFTGANWPKSWAECLPCIVVGVLMHGVYGGGVFASIYHGINITLCALILSLQPIVTVLFSVVFLGEKLTSNKVIGILAGFIGVSVMILDGYSSSATLSSATSSASNDSVAIMLCVLALLAISSGSIIQKKCCNDVEPLPGAFIQFASAMYFMIPFALMFETIQANWVADLVLGLGWLVVFVSIGAMTLLMILIRNDNASAVANLFYLVTPIVAIESCILLGEKLSLLAVVGMLMCLSGVFVVNYGLPVKPRLGPTQLRDSGA